MIKWTKGLVKVEHHGHSPISYNITKITDLGSGNVEVDFSADFVDSHSDVSWTSKDNEGV